MHQKLTEGCSRQPRQRFNKRYKGSESMVEMMGWGGESPLSSKAPVGAFRAKALWPVVVLKSGL